MLDRFTQFVTELGLVSAQQKTLLGVSGGVDSVVMAELFYRTGHSFAIAHCNFGLRDKESDGDEKFVNKLAEKYNVPCFIKRFDTGAYAKKYGISTQMAARELRYQWFEQIRQEKNYDNIAVATHKNDEIETVLINMLRGTGLAGYRGILPKRDNIIRPLLWATRKDIEQFTSNEGMAWREDSSNAKTTYIRNRIRHDVVPVLKEINPALEDTFSTNANNLKGMEAIYRQAVAEKRKELIREHHEGLSIAITELKQLEPLDTWLFELLREFGFNSATVDDIIASFEGQSGKRFYSPSHELLKNRDELIISPMKKESPDQQTNIGPDLKALDTPVALQFETTARDESPLIEDTHIAQLDYDKLEFPLQLRKWQAGDSFVPLGMKGRKKLSDFLIDSKVSRIQKDNTFVLTSNCDIVWVVGHRIDHRYKVNEQTSKVFKAAIEQ